MPKRLNWRAKNRALRALALMQEEDISLREASRRVKVGHDTVERVGKQTGALFKSAGRWEVEPTRASTVRRGVLKPSGWQGIRVMLGEDADVLRDYAAAIRSRDPKRIAAFEGIEVVDAQGRTHVLLTDVRIIQRLDRAGEAEPPDWAFGETP